MEEDEFNIKAYTESLLHSYSTPDAIMPTLHTNWPQKEASSVADYYINTGGQVSSGSKFLGNKFVYDSNSEYENQYEHYDKNYKKPFDQQFSYGGRPEIWNSSPEERKEYNQMRLLQLLKPVQPQDGVDIADIW